MFPFSKEQAVNIPGPNANLEAVIHQSQSDGQFAALNWLVLLCHPHPLHGGTMDNKVVTTLMRTYRDLGVHVVRFNFRGVGKSEGAFDHAIGEQDDLLAVAAWAQQQLPEVKLLLAGFSFGSSVAAQVSYRLPQVVHLTLVAPPVERYPYARDGQFPCPLCVIQGDKDERVNAEGVYLWCSGLSGATELLRYPEAGHFFHGYLTELKADLTQALIRQLA